MCPSLVDKEKLIRDQASKTVDTYIARIKKYTVSMPDTVLQSSPSSGPNQPRMGTPANDTSWAGWAISSFTNKLSAANGEIRAGNNTNGNVTQLPSSVPPIPNRPIKPSVPLASKPGMMLSKSSTSIPTLISPEPAFGDEEADFGDDWGGFDNGDITPDLKSQEKDDNEEFDDAWGTPAVTTTSTSSAFDDNGEPDFAGWLAAKKASKQPVKNALPKGLVKPSTAKSARPIVGGRSGTGSTVIKKVVVAPKKEAAKPKAEEKKVPEEEEDGWGEAW
jgi:SCY1-like protein 1